MAHSRDPERVQVFGPHGATNEPSEKRVGGTNPCPPAPAGPTAHSREAGGTRRPPRAPTHTRPTGGAAPGTRAFRCDTRARVLRWSDASGELTSHCRQPQGTRGRPGGQPWADASQRAGDGGTCRVSDTGIPGGAGGPLGLAPQSDSCTPFTRDSVSMLMFSGGGEETFYTERAVHWNRTHNFPRL